MSSLSEWDKKRLALAALVAGWSKDSAKVGAVIADRYGRVIALGYNGFAGGIEDSAELLEDDEEKLDRTVHAEVNAVLIAGRAAEDGTLYAVGKPVCARCAGVVICSPIQKWAGRTPRRSGAARSISLNWRREPRTTTLRSDSAQLSHSIWRSAAVPGIAGLPRPTKETFAYIERLGLPESDTDQEILHRNGARPLMELDRGGLGRAAMEDPIIGDLPDLSASLRRLIAHPGVEQHAQCRDKPKRLV